MQELLIQRSGLESIAAATRADVAALQEACEEAATEEQALRRQLDALQVSSVARQNDSRFKGWRITQIHLIVRKAFRPWHAAFAACRTLGMGYCVCCTDRTEAV